MPTPRRLLRHLFQVQGSNQRETDDNCLKAAATTEPCVIKRIEDKMTALKQSLERHRQEAAGAHKYFMDVTKKCSKEWAEIVELNGKLT